MSSTNKTTHYNLSQYIASDKPTYLVDYNADMSAIDSGIYAAKSEANTNTSAIGNLESLNTTAKNNLVGAINEIDGNLGTLSGTVGQHTTDIATNTSAIGNLASLNTTAKNNLVSAINETRNSFDVEIKKTYQTTDSITPVNATITGVNIKIAKSTNGDIGKIYGNITFIANYSASSFTLPNSSINTNSPYGIDNIVMLSDSTGTVKQIKPLTVNDNELYMVFTGLNNGTAYTISIIPVMLYFKDFGDTPAQ